MTSSADTTTEAGSVQLAILREMTGSDRVAMAFEMSGAAHALTEAGIRHRHPDWSPEQVRGALLTQLLGRELAQEVRSRLLPE